MNFDADRKGTGTAEWAEVTENICRGCANNCLYCYAAHNANRFNQRPRAEWEREEFTKRAAMTSYPARDGVVMFPSSHDITPFNVDEYVRVAKLILGKGNKLLIVTKPDFGCVRKLLMELSDWVDQILLRFTIGTTDPSVSKFWEPGAPLPADRLDALKMAWNSGFATSVSIEPMLSDIYGAQLVVDAVLPRVTETIWIGKMNKALLRVDKRHKELVESLLWMQRDSEIIALYNSLNDNPQIRWKDSIKEVVARAL